MLSRKDRLTFTVEGVTRIAVVNEERCKPQNCNQECKNNCPVVKMGKLCIEVTKQSKTAFISESLCNGCGICVKKCPFNAIKIINLPKELTSQTTHRFHANSFKLHRLPYMKAGKVIGLVGSNGTGKSTALKILSGKLKPNFGLFDNPPSWEEIVKHFRGSELQNYFNHLLQEELKVVIKPQHVYLLPRMVRGNVGELIEARDERKIKDRVIEALDLQEVLKKDIANLSGGELQRLSIAIACMRNVQVYMFDEPSSFLDIKQRINAGRLIREIVEEDPSKYVIVVEHDLSVIDFMANQICLMYGTPSVYGVITLPHSVGKGINSYLAGFLRSENLRFRDYALEFTKPIADEDEEIINDKKKYCNYSYPKMSKTMGSSFELEVEEGSFTESEIIVLLGPNGTGKTTFIKMLAGRLAPDLDEKNPGKIPELSVSYKPQEVAFKVDQSMTVSQLLAKKISPALADPLFVSEILKPSKISAIMSQTLDLLSGGESQRVALVLALGTKADIYLLDEPSAFLDVEQRLAASKIIKRFIMHYKKTAFIVEHDFIMANYLADRVIVFDGIPAVRGLAHSPSPLAEGLNGFLKNLNVTIRRDKNTLRPKINRAGSQSDREQKREGRYYLY